MIWFLPPRFLNPLPLKSLSLSEDNKWTTRLASSCTTRPTSTATAHNAFNAKKFGTMGIVGMISTVPNMTYLTKRPQEQ